MKINFVKDIDSYLNHKYPNKNIYIISDHHFFHNNILSYERPYFLSIDEMHSHIINSHNKIIKEDDIVFFLGDFSFKKNEIETINKQMNGIKFLLLGNHDDPDLYKNYKKYGFEEIFINTIRINNTYLSHKPLTKDFIETSNDRLIIQEFEKNNNAVNYHGHIHSYSVNLEKCINVSCEVIEYKPLLLCKTKNETLSCSKQINLINSECFNEVVSQISKEKYLNENIIINDYIYSLLLEETTSLKKDYIICGSYAMLKNNNFISDFSDLDLSYIYDSSKSYKYNVKNFKEKVKLMYDQLSSFNIFNGQYVKKYNNVSIFEYLFTNDKLYAKSAVDTNLVKFNLYKETDFHLMKKNSIIENSNILNKDLEEYKMPQYEALFISNHANLSSIILQLIFQKGFEEKKDILTKKSKVLTKLFVSENIDIDLFEDTLMRFLIKNISFFETTNRQTEINHMKNLLTNFDFIKSRLPERTNDAFENILTSKNSRFYDLASFIETEKAVDNTSIIKHYEKIKK